MSATPDPLVAPNERGQLQSPSSPGLKRTAEVTREAWLILRLMIPLSLKFYFGFAAGGLALALIGHFDTKEENIAGALLGRAYSDVTGLSIGVGITLGLSTCISQNHGRGADHENGWVLKRCATGLCVAMVFSMAAACSSKAILRSLGQPAEVLDPCQYFAIINALSLPGSWYACAVGNVMISMNLVSATVFADTLAASLNMVMTYVFLRYCEMGYIGAAWAQVVASYCQAAFIFFYVKYQRKEDVVWKVIPRDACSSPPITLKTYLGIAMPSAFSLWAEWWAGQILSIFAGWLPAGDLAVGGNGIIFRTLGMFYMTFVSMQVTTTTRVGNLVGKKQARRIPVSIAIAVCLCLLLSGASSVVLQIWGDRVLGLYTHDAAILEQAFSGKLGMVLSIMPYSAMMCLLGALRGAGLQTWGAIALAIAFYVFGLPASAFLAFGTDLKLLGIWLGNALGLTISAVSMGFRLICVDWEKVVEDAATLQTATESLQQGLRAAADQAAVQDSRQEDGAAGLTSSS